MTVPAAIILSSIIIGAAIVGSNFVNPYQLAMSGNGKDFSAWRINKRTGQVVACQITYDPFEVGGNTFDGSPAPDSTKPMVVIKCGED